ncbi:MAG TPA: tetratricopeptide repeat protein [Phycisphaerae bacterium]|nr:tetratricopeptide repeat protein [Phycisphaerae bacterium]
MKVTQGNRTDRTADERHHFGSSFTVVRRNDPRFSFALGIGVLAWGGCSGAKNDVDNGMQISAATHMASASMLERQKNLSGAMKQYEEVIASDPKATSAYHGLSRVQFMLGRYDDAENALARGLCTDDNVPAMHNNLGCNFLQQKKYENAEECFRRALELSPSFRRARMNLGMTLAKMNRVAEAVEEFRKIVAREDAHFNVAVVRAQEEDYDGAAAALREALAFNPQYTPALDHLDRMVRIGRAEKEAKAALSRLAARNAVASFGEPVGSASQTHQPTCALPDNGFNDHAIAIEQEHEIVTLSETQGVPSPAEQAGNVASLKSAGQSDEIAAGQAGPLPEIQVTDSQGCLMDAEEMPLETPLCEDESALVAVEPVD